jgi:hypothetical protein
VADAILERSEELRIERTKAILDAFEVAVTNGIGRALS